MKHYRITLEGHTYDVEVLDDPRQRQVRVRVDGEVLTVEAETAMDAGGTSPSAPVPSAASPLIAPASIAATGVVKAPLPGVVRSIAVSPGERVAAGDELLVIEAMKMNNVIRAPHGGTVSFIYVSEGRQVPHGEPLLHLQEEP
jgi:biotin carboxyl carrier protein